MKRQLVDSLMKIKQAFCNSIQHMTKILSIYLLGFDEEHKHIQNKTPTNPKFILIRLRAK